MPTRLSALAVVLSIAFGVSLAIAMTYRDPEPTPTVTAATSVVCLRLYGDHHESFYWVGSCPPGTHTATAAWQARHPMSAPSCEGGECWWPGLPGDWCASAADDRWSAYLACAPSGIVLCWSEASCDALRALRLRGLYGTDEALCNWPIYDGGPLRRDLDRRCGGNRRFTAP